MLVAAVAIWLRFFAMLYPYGPRKFQSGPSNVEKLGPSNVSHNRPLGGDDTPTSSCWLNGLSSRGFSERLCGLVSINYVSLQNMDFSIMD
jgi:hypothetical protein